ncbi:WXG100 family type VII secretion target [Streptomyces sp. BBFR2]|uniref:WXG100 family type VII secretion target n=1 Tax=Streptomyces sp. BBFR2 TaxID=3372854 RepID=UPI0037D9FBB7
MTSDYMSVDTAPLNAHGRELSDHAEAVRAAHDRFRDSLAALGTPWGAGDDYAEAFTQWYSPATEKLQESLKGITEQMEQAHRAVRQASGNYQANAEAAE